MKFWERFKKPQEEVEKKPEKPREESAWEKIDDEVELDRRLDVVDENLEQMKTNGEIAVEEAERLQKQLQDHLKFININNVEKRITLKNSELSQWKLIFEGLKKKE